VPHFLAVPRILMTTDLVAMMPRRLATRFIKAYPLTLIAAPHDAASFAVSALWHTRLGARADIVWFRGLVRAAATGLDTAPVAAAATKPRRARRKAA